MSQATFEQLGEFLRSRDCFEILTHAYPDGDTLGSGFALALALNQIGKRARVITTGVPKNFEFLSRLVPAQDFEAQTVVSVHVADEKLLGDNIEAYEGRIDLCVDHHAINRVNAKQKHVDPHAASNCEILYRLFRFMDIEITADITDCLYTGVSTDTGCFRYSNVTARTHRIAADLIERGADHTAIDVAMFETKDMSFLRLQQKCLEALELYFDGRVSVLSITRALLDETGCKDEDCDAIVALSRQIAGVQIGVTFKEKKDGTLKVSVRTHEGVDASAICAVFGGGGHKRAAGCQFTCRKDEALKQMLPALECALAE